jgi:magnesium transporter
MSEWSMMTGPENWRVAYPAFMLAMVVVGFANYYLLVRFERKRRRGNAAQPAAAQPLRPQ